MLDLSLMMVLLAFFTLRLARNVTGEIAPIILRLSSIVCLLVCLLNMSWIIQLAVAIALLTTPTCSSTSHQAPLSCSRQCLLRSQCHTWPQ
ncbi:hypothetical protein [Oculatella sp. LEGE 06141]|uniref:hypothetical protein n=1 Tax=Oculatella sp. LEGE 06141 TaxID=1828648 RepID=UPI0030DBB659